MPDDARLKEEILRETHRSNYGIHPGSTEMYRNLQQHYWWNGMKKDVAKHVARCLTYQQVKAQHCKPGRLLRPLEIPEWKWEHITMDFITGLLRSQTGHDTIWEIVDRLTKSAQVLAVRKDFALDQYAELYVQQRVRLHGVPILITSHRDPRFTANF